MRKANFIWLFQVAIVIVLYYVLAPYIESTFLLVGLVVATGIIVIAIRALLVRNEGDVLEVLVDPDKHFNHIEKYRDKNPNTFNLLQAYGNTYIGEFEKAKQNMSSLEESMFLDQKHLHYEFIVTKLHILYKDADIKGYEEVLEQAKLLKVFILVDIPKDAFDAHLLILEGKNKEAEELLIKVIPRVRKRILLPELEYLLALAYFRQDKFDDATAVLDFMIEKDYPIIYTQYMKEIKEKIQL